MLSIMVYQVKLKSTQHVLVVLASLVRVTPPPAPAVAPGPKPVSTAAPSWSNTLHLPERAMINEALRRWKDLDVELTEATNEVLLWFLGSTLACFLYLRL